MKYTHNISKGSLKQVKYNDPYGICGKGYRSRYIYWVNFIRRVVMISRFDNDSGRIAKESIIHVGYQLLKSN